MIIPKIIHLSYRKVINSATTNAWEKYVLEGTHKEFYMQAQRIDQTGEYTSFKEMIRYLPDAVQLHGRVSTAAMNSIQQLSGIMPDVLNTFEQPCIPFQQFRFEIIQSHTQDIDQHQVAIHFYSDPLTWLYSFDTYLLLSAGDQSEALKAGEEVNTFMVSMIPQLSITSVRLAS